MDNIEEAELGILIEDLICVVVAYIKSPNSTPKDLSLYLQDRNKAKMAIVNFIKTKND